MDHLRELLEKKKPVSNLTYQAEIEQQRHIQYLNQTRENQLTANRKFCEKLDTIQSRYTGENVQIEEFVQKKLGVIAEQNQEQSHMANQVQQRKQSESIDKEITLSFVEIKKQLRALQQPITLFGETDQQRYRRLLWCQEVKQEVKQENIRGNVYNILLKMKDEQFRLMDHQDDEVTTEKLADFEARMMSRASMMMQPQSKLQQSIKKIPYEVKCEDSYLWCKKILLEWEKDLSDKCIDQKWRKSIEGQFAIGSYRQSLDYLKTLLDLMKERKVSVQIIEGLFLIASHCMVRQYVRANYCYLELAIGNAPWPMGVTMIDIHERSGRSKIFSSQIAHILNDETQRKYLQAIKRLVTQAEGWYPATNLSEVMELSKDVDEKVFDTQINNITKDEDNESVVDDTSLQESKNTDEHLGLENIQPIENKEIEISVVDGTVQDSLQWAELAKSTDEINDVELAKHDSTIIQTNSNKEELGAPQPEMSPASQTVKN